MHSHGAEVHRDFGPVLLAAPVAPAMPLQGPQAITTERAIPPAFASVGLAPRHPLC